MVVTIGTGKRLENGERKEFKVKPGDKVLFSKYGGTQVIIDDQEYSLIHEDDILALLSQPAETQSPQNN